ncbi:MAG: metal-sensing transcriptional repressor [Erysipelotrichaceae bacterium]|jgi:DNA-binding FrmR family transcriptional regulator
MDECKHTHREQDEQTKLINRLNRLEGQIRGIKNMVEEDVYCDDILIQVAAVKSALDAFSTSLFENHLKTCVVRDIKEGHPEIVEEVLTTIKRLTR